jgi:hypothetical protein
MADTQLSLTEPERAYLAELLQDVLKQTQIEEHRTRTLSYRESVLKREDAIVSILTKLGKPPA